MEIKHKTIVLDMEVKMNPDKKAQMIDETINAFLDGIQKTIKYKDQSRLEIFEKSIETYYYEASKPVSMRRLVYLISFFYKIS